MAIDATSHIFLFALSACLNCHLAAVPEHMAALDVGCAFGIAWATAHLSKRGGSHVVVRVALVLMLVRWLSSLFAVAHSSAVALHAKKLAMFAQMLALCALACR